MVRPIAYETDLRDAALAAGARALAIAKAGGIVEALQLAEERREHELAAALKAQLTAGVTKAQVAGQTTASAGEPLGVLALQAQALVAPNISTGFFDRLRGDAIEAPLFGSYGVAITRPAAGLVDEGHALPVTAFASSRKVLAGQRVGSIIVLTNELLRFAGPDLFEQLLRDAIASATDAAFVAQLGAVISSVSSFGGDPQAIAFALRTSLSTIDAGATARFHLGLPPAVCQRLSVAVTDDGAPAYPQMTPAGGTLSGMTVTASDAFETDGLLVDATAILAASSDVEIDAARHATIHMEAPAAASVADGSPPAPVESDAINTFQGGATALRVTRLFDWDRLRAACACRITGVSSWGLDFSLSPPM